MTCSRESLANPVGAGFLAMRAAVLRDGAFDFSAGGARPNRSRNRMRGGNVVDAGAHHRHRLPGETWIRERFHVHLRRGELVRDRNPRWLREDAFEWPFSFDVDREVCLRKEERELGGWLLKPLADARERFIRQFMRGDVDNRRHDEARREQRQSHAIKTMMPRVQPAGARQ